jgi:cell division septum initiation protein DivIVA
MDAVLESQRALVEAAEQTSAVISLLFYFSAFIVITFSSVLGFVAVMMKRNQTASDLREARLISDLRVQLAKHEELHDWIRTSWTENHVLVRQTGEALRSIAVSASEQVNAFASMERSHRDVLESVATLMQKVQEVVNKEVETHRQLEAMPCVVACKLNDPPKSGGHPRIDRPGHP